MRAGAARASADAEGASGDVGRGVAYERRGETRAGVVERRDGKAGYVVRECPSMESVKVSEKSIEMRFARGVDACAVEAFASAVEADRERADALLAAAWELIDEFGVEDGAVCDATYVSELMFEGEERVEGANAFAALRLLSSPLGGTYFKLKGKGAYEPRPSDQIEALKKKTQAEARAAAMEGAFLDEIRAAVAAPRGSKPDPATLWRSSEDDNDARVRRRASLEAYALGEKFFSAGEKAMADDLLGKLGFQRSSESALKMLISTGTWSTHENISVRKYGVPIDFPRDALSECASILANAPADADASSRVDLTHLRAYAIDDASTVEVDDAVSAESLGDGRVRVWVHIADPSRWISVGSSLDVEAKRRATTVYYPTESVPMFPLDIAAGPMSLGARAGASEAVSVRADVNADGVIEDYEIAPSLVKIDKRWTYDEVDVELDSATCDEALRLLYKVANVREEYRAENGSVTIILPENSIDVQGASASGGDGDVVVTMTKLKSEAPARMLVSELMVLAGDVVAQFGVREKIPLPYRGQGEPRLMSDSEWDAIPEGICQDMAMRSCMSASTSGSTPRPHAGLGLGAYVQFTSPIRRYADLMAHYQIKAHLRGEPLPYNEESMERAVEDLGAALGGASRSARETTKYWAAVYFASQSASARWKATVVKIVRGDDLVIVIFDDLGFETIVKLDRPAILGDSVTLKFVDAEPHAGLITFARVDE